MPKKLLNVLTQGHRATLEEQDDPVLWLTTLLHGSGGDVAVLLRGAAIGLAVKAQDASGLRFGARAQTRPPRLATDVARLVEKGVRVLYVEDDARERGLHPTELVEGLVAIARAGIPDVYGRYEQVWTW